VTRSKTAVLVIATLLAACGGGGDDPQAERNDPMKKNRCTSAALSGSMLLAACGGGGSTAPVSPTPTDPIAADVIVQLKPGTSVAELARAYNLGVVDQFGQRPIWQLRVAAGANPDVVVERLAQDPGVRFAERNQETDTPEGRKGNSPWAVGGDAGVWASQWAPQAINLAAAHAMTTGQGVRVAVLDTGIDLLHPVLAPRLARSAGGALLGRDFVDNDADPSEVGSTADAGFGHGTHVAGLVALAAPSARLMPVRVLDPKGRGNIWVLAEALGWAVDPDGNPSTDDGAHVINLSLSTSKPTQLIRTVSELADCSFDDDDDDFVDPGFDADKARCAQRFSAVVTAAAGNGGSETEVQYPAGEDVKGLLSVGASAPGSVVADLSNRGSWVKLAAPGETVVSTVPGGGWGVWSGTSMASPLAAGVAALVLSSLPSGGDAALPPMRQWSSEIAAKRLSDRSSALCGSSLRQLDALAALMDLSAVDPACP
jgi:subtilisin family serine protease